VVARLNSFVDVLRAQAAERPQQNAFVFLENGEREADALTYAELDRDARAIAGLLQQHTRVGDRALLLYPPGLDFVRAFMGCLYAGVVAVPVYPPRRNRTLDRLNAVAADAQTTVALTNAAVGKALGKALPRGEGKVLGVPALIADRDHTSDPHAWRPPSLAPADLAFLQYTSGSTGTPKGVMITHGNLLHNNELIKVAYSHSPASVFVSWLPVFHDMGLIGMVLQPIYAGSRSVLMEPAAFLQKPVRWLRAITRYRGTTSGAPNSAYELCVRKVTPDDRATLDLSSWEFAYNGAEPVRASTVRRFHETFAACGLRLDGVQPCYGMAETTLLVSIAGVGKTPTFHASQDGSVWVSSGRTWLDERVLIVDPEAHERCAEGKTGEIWIASGSVAAGYWNRPVDTAAAFGARTAPDSNAPNGDGPFFRTGDLGFMRGDQLFVTGRLKDLIIIRGRNLYPQDVEYTAGNAHPALSADAAAAFSIASDAAEDSEQLVVVCEVAREQLAKLKTPESLHAVLQAVRQAVAEEHDVDPAAIVLLRTLGLPKTSSGKVQRRACRERFLLGTLDVVGEWRRPVESADVVAVESGASYEAVRDWLVARIAGQAGMAPDRLNLSDPFSRYGLDSQRAVILSGELQDWLGRPLPATIAYDFPSIDALARHLGSTVRLKPDTTYDSNTAGTDPDGQRTQTKNEPIAIVGIGCRFPGAATPEQFWDRLIRGLDMIGPAPASRPHAADLGHGGFLEDVERFDASFFGVTPREAEIMDPQQRLLLEVAWEAIESAGIPAERLAGSRTGVFIGISNLDYLRLQAGRSSSTDPYAGTGNALSIAANRLSYLFDLRGPSWAVDTACSSSLVAVHQACESLRAGESDAALCGGVNLILSPQLTSVFTRAGMMSPSHRCRTFDASADGYVRGEGAAVVVLKRLSDAVRDGDTIHAVIRGSAVNQDGRSNGLTAPNGPAQQAVIRAALRAADVEPARIGYVETHGTGTPLGDPIEMNALMGVLGEGRSPSARCAVASLKTNIGHLEAAAGIAGLIKAALVLQHGAIPPHLHFSSLNPHMTLDGTAFVIPTTAIEWRETDGPRLAGVSSFGFGGTNAHVILEEPPAASTRAAAVERPVHALTLSAKSEVALAALAASTAGYLREHTEVSLADAAFTGNTGRTVFPYRAAIVATSSADAATRLESVAARAVSKGAFSGMAPASDRPRIAFLFTGQGSQFAGMAKDLFDDEPVFRRAMLEFDETFRAVSGASLLDVIYPDPEVRLKPDTTYDRSTTYDQSTTDSHGYVVSGFSRTLIDDTLYTQPALFAVECALARLWASWGIEPDAVMGHSVGEFAAAAVAGLIDPHDGLRLVAARARLMQALPRNGSMRVVFADRTRVEAAVAPYQGRVAIAANNGPSNTVISGETAAVETIAADLRSAGIATSPLNTSHAFHSPLMEPMVAAFRSELDRISFGRPRMPIVSNVTGRVGDETMRDPRYWCRHILEAVQFAAGIDTLHALGARRFVEVGPRPDLIAMARRVLTADESVVWVPSLQPRQPALTSMLEGAAMLWVRGARVAWQAVDDPRARHRVSLPSYPFERQRFWIDESEPLTSAADPSAHPLLGRRLAASAHAPDTYSWESSLSVDRLPYLAGHSVLGSTVLPYAAFVEMALAASAQVSGGRTHRVTGLQLHHPVVLSQGGRAQLQAVLDRTEGGAWRFRVYNRVGSSWTLSSSAVLSEAPTPHELRPDVLCRQ